MQRFQTQWYTNGEFRQLPGKPEDHNLVATVAYSFNRDGELWTVYMADLPATQQPVEPQAARQSSPKPPPRYAAKPTNAATEPNWI